MTISSRVEFTMIGAALAVTMSACGSGTPAKHAALPHPLFARCGTAGFGKPTASPTTARTGGAGGWQVAYTRVLRPRETATPGFISASVALIEEPGAGVPRRQLNGGHDVMIAGRSVSFLKVAGAKNGYAARWKTDAALYLALGNGASEPTVQQLIGCLP